jgi:hypothetical protein
MGLDGFVHTFDGEPDVFGDLVGLGCTTEPVGEPIGRCCDGDHVFLEATRHAHGPTVAPEVLLDLAGRGKEV